jgi:predicted dehydrogenase
MQRLRVGVIGAGGIAQIEHIPNLMKLKHQFEILGACDPSAKVRAFIGEQFGLAVFESVDQLLALSLDAVVIASPDPLHHEQVLAALARGLHVFCEKPLCYSDADIDDMIAARTAQEKSWWAMKRRSELRSGPGPPARYCKTRYGR